MKNLSTILCSMIFLSTITGQVYFQPSVLVESKPTTELALMDVGNDQDLDIVYIMKNIDQVGIIFNDGPDEPLEDFVITSNFFSPNDLAVGNFDPDVDGLDDFIVLSEDELEARVYSNDGGGSFALQAGDLGLIDMDTDDIDGDGDSDVAIISLWGEEIFYLQNDRFTNYNSNQIYKDDQVKFTKVAIGDIDGAGEKDFFVGSTTDGIHYIINQFVTDDPVPIDTDVTNFTELKSLDFDGDGDDDLVVIARRNTIYWYEQDAGSFIKHTITTDSQEAEDAEFVDIDGDGDMDFFTIFVWEGKFIWWENDGSQNFTPHIIAEGYQSPRDITAGDWDGDGDIDLIGGTAEIFEDERIILFEHVQEPVLSTNETTQIEVTIAPNPASEMINISTTGEEITSLQLKNVNGKMIYQSQPKSSLAKVSVSEFPSGIYLLQANTDEGVIMEKVVVER